MEILCNLFGTTCSEGSVDSPPLVDKEQKQKMALQIRSEVYDKFSTELEHQKNGTDNPTCNHFKIDCSFWGNHKMTMSCRENYGLDTPDFYLHDEYELVGNPVSAPADFVSWRKIDGAEEDGLVGIFNTHIETTLDDSPTALNFKNVMNTYCAKQEHLNAEATFLPQP